MTPAGQSPSGDAPDSPTTAVVDSGSGTVAQIHGTIAQYGARLVLSAIMGIVVSHALEPAGRGSYSVIVIIAAVASVLGHLSIGQASVSFWTADRGSIPATNLLIGPPLGLAAAALVGLAVLTLGSQFVPVADPYLLVVALAAVPAMVAVVHLTMVTLLLGRLDIVNRSLTISAILQCSAFVALAAAGRLTTAAVVWIWALASALPLFLLWPTVKPNLGRVSLKLARRLIAAGAQYHVGLVALFLLLRIDILILNGLTTVAQVGLYSLAVSVGEMAFAGTDAISQAMLRRQAEAGMADSVALAARTTRVAAIVAVVSVGALCAAAPIVVPLLYGPAFRGSVPALWALAPGLVAYSATLALGPYLLRLGRPRVMSSLALPALAGNVILNLLLTPVLGIVGAALATSAGYFLYAGGRVLWFCRAASVSPAVLVPRAADVSFILRTGLPFRR